MTHLDPLSVGLVALLLGVLGVREDTPAATTPRRAWADLRAAGWKRLAWLATLAGLGVAALVVATMVRAGLYGAALALAGLGCAAATALAPAGCRVRVRRIWGRA